MVVIVSQLALDSLGICLKAESKEQAVLKQYYRQSDYFIDKQILFDIFRRTQTLSGRNSAVECHLAKVDVDGSNPFARSIFLSKRRHSQVVRQRSAKPLFPGSSPGAASRIPRCDRKFSSSPFFPLQSNLSGREAWAFLIGPCGCK